MTLQEFAAFVGQCAVDSPIPVELQGAVMDADDRVRVRVRVGFEPQPISVGEPQPISALMVPCFAGGVPPRILREPDERLNVAIDVGADDLEGIPVDSGVEFVGDTVQELIARGVAEWVARRVTMGGHRLGTKNEALQSQTAPIVARAQPEGVLATLGETIIWRARKLRVVRVDQDAGEIDLVQVRT